MPEPALRPTGAEPATAIPLSPRAAPAVRPAEAGAKPVGSPPRAMQERLVREFGGRRRIFLEPVVEPWRPGVSMLMVLGGGVLLWTLLAGGARLALN